MTGIFKRFCSSESGNFALTLAICAAPLFAIIATATDYVSLNQQRSKLQGVVDGSALAVAKEMALANSKTLDVQSIAENYTLSQFPVGNGESLTVSATREDGDANVNVTASYVWQPFFIHYVDDTAMPIVASAKAGFAGAQSSICVLGLDPSSNDAVSIDAKSSMTANKCAVFSNSSSKTAFSVASGSTVSGEAIYSSGGYAGNDSDFSPKPITDAPPVADPLADRNPPPSGVCDFKDYELLDGTATLKPGVYCGGIYAESSARLELEPGIYVIKDGPLVLKGNSTMTGTHVGFYLTGDAAVFDFGVSTQVNLTAPKSGDLSGILFFEDRTSIADRTFTIRSKDAERFEGTIYLPQGTLFIDKASRVGQLSNWTAIIAKRINIGKGPQLVINSDYSSSDVPVPEGIATKGQIRLFR